MPKTPTQVVEGSIGGYSVQVTPTLAVSTTAYTGGDNVGGKLTLANVVREAGSTALLQSLVVLDNANQKAALEILLFDSDPTAGTYTDNAATTLSSDLAKCIGRVSVAATDYVTIDSKAIAELSGIGKIVKAAPGGTSLYAVITTTGTPTYAATTDLTVRFAFLQD